MGQILRIALVLFLASAAAWAQADVVTVKSPDGRIEFRLLDGPPPTPDTQLPHLAYQVDYNGKPLILTSYLGFEIYNQVPLGTKLGLVKTYPDKVDETYTLAAGKSKTVRNQFNEIVAEYLQNGSLGRLMTVEVRAFNDGVAFRYVVQPSPPLLEMRIENEMTEFHFAKDGEAFPLLLPNFQSAYEDQVSRRTLSTIQYDSLVGLPFLVQQPGVAWAAVTEADLDEYAGLYLKRTDRTTMHARLSPRVDGSTLSVFAKTPLVTPWRVLLIGDRPEKLLESNIVTSLAVPTKLKDTSWVQPGKITRASVDFAVSAGLEYLLTDSVTDELVVNARQKKIGVWVAADWRAVESDMDRTFPQWEKLGVRGVKIDGWNRDDQDAVALLHKVAAKAAEHKLMLAIGGGYKPDGIQRTFPNVLTVEAALNSDYAKVGAAANPEHEVLLAYTRLLAGPLDHGLGGFENVTQADFTARDISPMTLGTRAHQLALYVVFECPLQAVNGTPQSYENQRDFDFVKAVPSSWDATRVANGEVGEYLTIARSRGREWYLGAITNWTARELDVPLSFLSPGDYIADIYADASDAATSPKHTAIEQRRVNAGQSLHLTLASGGGAAVRFRPAN